jgi:hypothetical protein
MPKGCLDFAFGKLVIIETQFGGNWSSGFWLTFPKPQTWASTMWAV